MSGSSAKVYLVDVSNWLSSLRGILDKLTVFKLVKNFPSFFGKPKILYTGVHRYRTNSFCTVASNYLRVISAELLFWPYFHVTVLLLHRNIFLFK
jgi:hypothetical protein